MAATPRNYAGVLALLETIQSNRFVQKLVSSGNRDMNQDAIPEMLDWVHKAGYKPEDFSPVKVVHVAGTKGKGSVSAMVSSILQQYSKHSTHPVGDVGLYTSPHLVSVRERICIGGTPISKDLFTKYFFEIWDRFESYAAASGHADPTSAETKPGYFRFLTILALHIYLREGIRTAVVECGIGGEYDSTNILPKESVQVTVITQLGIDHVGMLGSTIDKIAWHKAGIMKHGIDCITAPQADEALDVLQERADEKGAVLQVVNRMKQLDGEKITLGLEGDFQKDNASLAIVTAASYLNKSGLPINLNDVELSAEFKKGLEEVKWRGRCEVQVKDGVQWCIDGAHTLESIEVTAKWFAEKLKKSNGRAVLIFNQQDRNVGALLEKLNATLLAATGSQSVFSHAVFCTNIPSKAELKTETTDLTVQNIAADVWRGLDQSTQVKVCTNIEEGIEYAKEVTNGQEHPLVLVTGSLYLVGGFIKIIDGNPSDLP